MLHRKFQKNTKIKFASAVANKSSGIILSGTLVFGVIAVALIVVLTSWFAVVLNTSRTLIAREQAFHIAEAGIEYYRWHLAHAPEDFQDGTGAHGPYLHEVRDISDEIIGHFSLTITPPPTGTTLVTVESTGAVESNPESSRTVRAELAKPSFAKFAFVSDAEMRFGEGTEVFGPIHSNGGIRFDGLAHNLVTSARDQYDDPDHAGGEEFGVHTHIAPTDPLPPTAMPVRSDVFEAGREISVPAADFDGLTSDLSNMKTIAKQPEGLYFAESGALGYRAVLKTNDTVDVYRVTSLASVPNASCNNVAGQDGWGTWSVGANTLIGNYDFPENGVMFFEDNIWVEGQIDEARLTIAAGRFPDIPSNRRSITVNNDLLYTNYDGTDVLALIAQNNINAGLYSADDYRIDAALVAQNGRIGRYYYRPPYNILWWTVPGCSPFDSRDTITLYGMLATRLRYGFSYTDDTGYETRNINYDANLLYGPPPQFPLTTDSYEPISWQEVTN